jgi:arylsulfatase A-like enzyme
MALSNVLALGIALLVASAPWAAAQCTSAADAKALKRTVRLAARCNDRILKSGTDVVCAPVDPPPACAGTLATDAVRLAYGPNDPPASSVDTRALKLHVKCQKRIGKAVNSYISRKLRALQKGDDTPEAEARARRLIDKLPDRCAITVTNDVSGVTLPAVGVQCGAATDPVGNPVDGTKLADCLATLLDTWVDRIGPSPQPLRPNILFILTDDQRWDSTDATHSPAGAFLMPRTRAELTDDGLEFTQAFMTTPLCCPSRSSILAGSYAHRTGVYKNSGTNGGADDFADAESIAVWLQNAGYRTSLIGKYLNGYQGLWDDQLDPPYVPPGWTEWRGMKNVSFFNYTIIEPDGAGGYMEVDYGSAEADYSTDVLREKAKTFISDSVAAGEPFFLYLAFKAPHLPQIPAPRHEGMFQSLPAWRPPSYNEADVSDKPLWVQLTPPMTPAEMADLDQVRIDQLEMLQAVDEAIGGNPTSGIVGVMEHLRTLGVADDTLVVFFSDNGWSWGEHRFRAKNKPYDEAIRSPMFVRYPKLAPCPRTDTRFALNIDLAPTFAELVGVGVPIAHDGQSLLRVFDATAPTWRSDFLTEGWPTTHPWATVREEQWKYTETPLAPGDPGTGFELELYDLVSDPYELLNVAGDSQHVTRIATMAARLRQLRPNWPIDSDPEGPDPSEED